ncbi:MAG: flagellar biosynthesis protein FlhF [Planctomycetota bacterium]|nr:flagellar biosynthesis protein FlhF [Planctomycetota bacterium]
MNSKIYRANTMSQAVEGLRRDLGRDAVILETRTVRRNGFWGWLGATLVEVHAATAAEVRAAREQPASEPKPASVPTEPTATTPELPLVEVPGKAMSELPPDREATRRMARAMLERLESESSEEPKPGPIQANTVRSELGELRDLVGQVLRQQSMKLPDTSVPEGIPEEMVAWYVDLISAEVSRELATRVIESASQELGGQFHDRHHVRDCIIQHLSRFVPTANTPLPDPPANGPLVIAMIGPTGVGKTTTTAKIAATCRLHRGGRVALVTCDTYRVAAVAQLRTYAEILGMPLYVAEQPEQVQEVLASIVDADVVIIDTPGRSQRDEGRLDELSRFLAAASPHQTHLVLSGTAGEQVLLREAEAFLPLGVDRIVLTKLDEAVSFGMLVDVLHRIGRELSFVTTGQEVPADIEPASGDHLATLALRGTNTGGTLRSLPS